MKISNSKKQLAKIISENGGWRDGARFAAQDSKKDSYPSRIGFYLNRPEVDGTMWLDSGNGMVGRAEGCINGAAAVPNWHQTILSRDEYFHLYPAPDADGWIEWHGGECPVESGVVVDVRHRDGEEFQGVIAGRKGGGGYAERWVHDEVFSDIVAYRLHKSEIAPDAHKPKPVPVLETKPTIEQLAADYRNRQDYAERKQQEADAAKAEAEAKLAELVAAGKAVGLVLSVAASDPELVITDWRDLQVGDIIECIGNWENEATDGRRFAVTKLDPVFSQGFKPIRIEVPGVSCPGTWGIDFKFIRRPAKEADNA